MELDRVRAITFDLDDTLWPCHDVIRAAEAECYAWLAQAAPRLVRRCTLDRMREHRLALAHRRPEIAHDMTALRLESMAQLLGETGYPRDIAESASDVFRAARNRVEPYAEVVGVLSVLRDRYTLVSVTNGNSQIEHTPLRDSFDHSLTAAAVGAAKPDPAIFHAASAQARLPLATFLHVGDDPVRDIDAARRLGLATVWVNRNGGGWPDELPRADIEMDDLSQLLALLAG